MKNMLYMTESDRTCSKRFNFLHELIVDGLIITAGAVLVWRNETLKMSKCVVSVAVFYEEKRQTLHYVNIVQYSRRNKTTRNKS
jgi:hypothetical protein